MDVRGLDRGWRTVVCAASGPSFSEQQAAQIMAAQASGKCRVIAVNDNWRRLPTADVLYACDGTWWDVHLAAVLASAFAGELWTQDKRASPAYVAARATTGHRPLRGLHHIAGKYEPGLATAGTNINYGRNSGFQVVNLAYLFGARRIVLVGYDMQRTDNKQHWFGDHPKPLSNEFPFVIAIGQFNLLAKDLEKAGVEVINSTERTALQCFKRAALEDAL